jgi:putative colanic acid biosynthesis acetyltransferase WcaF
MKNIDLSAYDNIDYVAGNKFKIILWYIINLSIFMSAIPFPSRAKAVLLGLFGAKIGIGVVVKPNVSIKYPWFLEVGNHCWIGEGVWIDNLAPVQIGDNVCISQGAYLLTGSHDYKKSSFDLITKSITIEDGVWIGAKSTVCPGVTCKSHSVLAAGSVATSDLEAYGIYQGNPAAWKRQREIA